MQSVVFIGLVFFVIELCYNEAGMEQVTNLMNYRASSAKDTKVKIRKNQYVSTAGNLILQSLNLNWARRNTNT